MSCKMCGDCCKRMLFELVDLDHAKWAKLHGLKVIEKDSKLMVELPIRCKMLGQDNLCQIQDQKPEMCKRYYCEKALSEPKNETDKKLSTEK